MSDTTNVTLRLDKELKAEAEQLFNKLGMNMTTAMNIFLRQAIREQGIPFRISTADMATDALPLYRGSADHYADYNTYISAMLQEAALHAAENPARYTAEDVRAHVKELLKEEDDAGKKV